jgi:hypothetical protein
MSLTLGAATKLLDNMMVNYSEWHTERAPQGKKVNSVEETSSLSDKIDAIMLMLSCRWISCHKNTGYHATDPKIRTQGAEHVRSRIATKHGDGSFELSNALRTAERDTELYPGSGPSW